MQKNKRDRKPINYKGVCLFYQLNSINKYYIMYKYNIFQQYKDQIINAVDLDDGIIQLNIALKLTENKTERSLLNSLVCDTRYTKTMDHSRFIVYLNVLNTITYYEDALTIIEDIGSKINDPIQLNILNIIINTKSKKHNKVDHFVIKKKDCPHCGRSSYCKSNEQYVICGYTSNRGFDWRGCGRDWCFKCGKKLCKHWSIDELFNKSNRIHDDKCCKSYANRHNDIYHDNYCSCVQL